MKSEGLELYPPFDGSQVCAQVDPELWHPKKGETNKQAKELCATCQFMDPCYQWALRRKVYGIWGGSTDKQRERERHRLKISLLPEPFAFNMARPDKIENEDAA